MTPRKPKSARELAARHPVPKGRSPRDTKFEGKPLWESFLPEADAVLEAIGWKEDVNHEAANRTPR